MVALPRAGVNSITNPRVNAIWRYPAQCIVLIEINLRALIPLCVPLAEESQRRRCAWPR